MSHVPALNPHNGVAVVDASELAQAPKATVSFGNAPDGLPWLLEVDRSARLRNLYSAVLSGFDLGNLDELPARVRDSLVNDVASGLLGIHGVRLEPDDEIRAAFVSRRPTRALLGRSVLAQLLEGSEDTPAEISRGSMATTNAGAVFETPSHEIAERLERSIKDRRANKHLLLTLKHSGVLIGVVDEPDRALRTPQGPYRPAVFESLSSLRGTEAVIWVDGGGESWTCPVERTDVYQTGLLRAGQSSYGGHVRYRVQRAAVLDMLIGLAEWVDDLHGRDRVHGDLAPGNVLLDRGKPVSFDALDIPTGEVAAAATFEWAAPEQILGRPIDPRADVFSIGKMATALLGGVAFGAEMRYVVPIGGLQSRKVDLLKTEGVFIDILSCESIAGRDAQVAWQELLGRCLCWDAEKRPSRGAKLAAELRELAARFPIAGTLEIDGGFGGLVQVRGDDERWRFARLLRD